VIFGVARNAAFLLLVGAVFRPMSFFPAGSASVFLCDAFPGDMVPVVAFHASDRFFLQFNNSYSAVANVEP